MTPEEIRRYREDWEKRAAVRRVLIEQICTHHNGHGCAKGTPCPEYNNLIIQLCDSDLELFGCKHGRHKYSDCQACDEEHMEAFPEYFGRCQVCNKLADLDELNDNKRCFDCQEEA